MNAQMHLETTEKEDFSQLLTLHHRELLVYARTLTQNEAAAKDKHLYPSRKLPR